jgi:hypothetical protein
MLCVEKPLKCARPYKVRWESGLGDLLWTNAQAGKAIKKTAVQKKIEKLTKTNDTNN